MVGSGDPQGFMNYSQSGCNIYNLITVVKVTTHYNQRLPTDWSPDLMGFKRTYCVLSMESSGIFFKKKEKKKNLFGSKK